jgi:hypothetical protein
MTSWVPTFMERLRVGTSAIRPAFLMNIFGVSLVALDGRSTVVSAGMRDAHSRFTAGPSSTISAILCAFFATNPYFLALYALIQLIPCPSSFVNRRSLRLLSSRLRGS